MVKIIDKIIMRRVNNILFKVAFILFIIMFCSSCTEKNVVFNDSYPLSNYEWNNNNCVDFSVDIQDTATYYRLGILVRNEGNYQYSNLWLFVDCQTPDSIVVTDTVQYFLCDDYGKWIGKSSIGSLYTTTFLYQDSVKYSMPGSYKYSISQAMRHDILYGIANIGLKVVSITE